MTRCVPTLAAVVVALASIPAVALDLGPQLRSKASAEDRAEKKAREACKIEICDIVSTREVNGPDVACDVGWSWQAEEIAETLGGRIDWTWGRAVCRTDLRLERAALANAMRSPRASIEAGTHTVACTLQDEGTSHEIEIELSPRISFKNGRATEARVNWGDVSAPAAIYPLLYAATGLDNTTNLLGPEAVRQVNKFIVKDCAAVKDELPGRRVN